MKGAAPRRVIVTALSLATATLLISDCLSPGGGTPEPAVYAATISKNGSCVTVAGYWKNGLCTALMPPDSTKNSVGYSLSLPATQVVNRNVHRRGADAASCPQRAISPFIEKNKQHPLFLASPLLATSVSHRTFMQKVKRKVTSSPHRAFAGSALPALSSAAYPCASPASNSTTLNSARWCRPPP
jgi:hypothetical protein